MIDLQYAFTWAYVHLYNKNCDDLQMAYFRANDVRSRSLAYVLWKYQGVMTK